MNQKTGSELLHKISSDICEPTEIIIIGGYAMTHYNLRENTENIDYINYKNKLVTNNDYMHNVEMLYYKYDKQILNILRRYGKHNKVEYGNLTVYYPCVNTLYALKRFSAEIRNYNIDYFDMYLLKPKIDEILTGEIYRLLKDKSTSKTVSKTLSVI